MTTKRILIVEDSRASQVGLAAFLRRIPGLKTFLVAESVAEALIFFRPEHVPPDVVILDLELPGGPGETLIEELIRRRVLPMPRIVVTSGICDRDRIDRVKSLCPSAFFSKPYSGEKLQAAIEAAAPEVVDRGAP